MFFSSEDRKNEILKFVRQNPQITKSNVIEHMTKIHMGTVMTTQPLLIELIHSGKITVLKDKPSSRNHKLVFNDENEFNRLAAEIARLENTSNRLIFTIMKDLYSRNIIKLKFKNTRSTSHRHMLNLIHFSQLVIYGRITALVEEIEQKINSQDDRQALYHLLPNLLLASDRLNRVMLPQVEDQITQMTDQFRQGITSKQSNMGNITKEIIRIVAVSYFKD